MKKYFNRIITLLICFLFIAIPFILGSDSYNATEIEPLPDGQEYEFDDNQENDENEQENNDSGQIENESEQEDEPGQEGESEQEDEPGQEGESEQEDESGQTEEEFNQDDEQSQEDDSNGETRTINIPYMEKNKNCVYWEATQLIFNEEHFRLYDFLFDAFTVLMENGVDYINEYDFIKNLWIEAMPDFDEETQIELWQMIEDENWTIDIAFPLEVPFKLIHHEFVLVYLVFQMANPQFHINDRIPMTIGCEEGLTPHISLPAYYAFAANRG